MKNRINQFNVYSKILKQTSTLDYQNLSRIGNAFNIEGHVMSNDKHYQDQFYFIYNANLKDNELIQVLKNCDNFDEIKDSILLPE